MERFGLTQDKLSSDKQIIWLSQFSTLIGTAQQHNSTTQILLLVQSTLAMRLYRSSIVHVVRF